MSKAIKAFFSGIILLTLLVQPAVAAEKAVKVKVKLVSVELVENNHVGNEWLTAAYVNGKQIKQGASATFTLKPSDTLKLKAFAEEQDKIPESGTRTASVKVSSITRTIYKSLTVEVVENRGRYSGNTAEWKFTFEIRK